jgi:hypothetical protein
MKGDQGVYEIECRVQTGGGDGIDNWLTIIEP